MRSTNLAGPGPGEIAVSTVRPWQNAMNPGFHVLSRHESGVHGLPGGMAGHPLAGYSVRLAAAARASASSGMTVSVTSGTALAPSTAGETAPVTSALDGASSPM